MHIPAFTGDIQLAKLLFKFGANVNDAVKVSLSACVDLSKLLHIFVCPFYIYIYIQNNFTPLHTAAFEGNLEVIKLFISFGANVNAVDTNVRM